MLRIFRTILIALLLRLTFQVKSNAPTLECNSKMCIQKCCDWDDVYAQINETLECIPANRSKNYSIFENITRIASNNMPCNRSTEFPVLIPIEIVTIFDNSSMIHPVYETLFPANQFCLEEKDGELGVLICVNKTMMPLGYMEHIAYKLVGKLLNEAEADGFRKKVVKVPKIGQRFESSLILKKTWPLNL